MPRRKQRPLFLINEKPTSQNTELKYLTSTYLEERETEEGAYLRVRSLNRKAVRIEMRRTLSRAERKQLQKERSERFFR